jgi:peptidyl-tRNA hydrolase
MKAKMYILVKDGVSLGHALVAAAHASLACYLRYQDDPEMAEWLSGSFRKVICRVTAEEFEKAKEVEDRIVITESSLLDAEVAIVFKPRAEYPEVFKSYPLFK